MNLRRLFLGLALGLPFFLCGAAGAEEGPAKGESRKPVPPALLQDLAGQMREDDGPPDPIEYLRSYRDWIQTLETPPPRTSRPRIRPPARPTRCARRTSPPRRGHAAGPHTLPAGLYQT